MSSPVLTFLGAADTVTGSRFDVALDRQRILVDAGLYQGRAALRRRNWEESGPPASGIDAVVLTHAHLDHCGYLPRLVREGFTGPVVCTRATSRLAEIVLRDSAHLQGEDADHANRSGYSKHHPALPLYDDRDVDDTLRLFRPTEYDAEVALTPDLRASLRPAGHILGSSTVLVEAAGTRTLFTGDLGRGRHPLLQPPAAPPTADVMVIESTYGDRAHPAAQPELLAAAIRRTVGRGGSVLIPAFAVDRTELVLIALHRLLAERRVPPVPVFVDSPMALAALSVYRQSAGDGSAGLRPEAGELLAALDSLDLRPVRDAAHSMRLNRPSTPCIVVSASGMATGGRVVHHLAHQLPDRRNTVILTGYQVEGTRGRQLLDGARSVKIHGRYVPVRAEVVQCDDFSVHADADDMITWLRSAPAEPRTVFVVHGEPGAAREMARRVTEDLGWCAVVPRRGERVRLD
jgi:metallo-beta-lactamase family protein